VCKWWRMNVSRDVYDNLPTHVIYHACFEMGWSCVADALTTSFMLHLGLMRFHFVSQSSIAT